jgi:alpha-L-fucosidase
VHENDEGSLREFRRRLDAIFTTDFARGARASGSNVRGGDSRFAAAHVLDGKRDTYWTTDDAVTTPELVLDLGRPVTFNVVSLREYLPLGQRVEDWALDAWRDGAWSEIARGTAIGSRRLWRGAVVTTTRVRLRVAKSPVCPAIAEVALHLEPAEAR